MQSDVLPFTMYDSMEYETVQNVAPPAGFVRRDAPQVQTRNDGPPPMAPVPNVGGVGPGTSMPTQKVMPKIDYRGDVTESEIPLIDLPDKSKKGDISNYKRVGDLVYIFLAVLFIDVVVIFLVRFFPDFFGSPINRWYDLFGLNAVIADVGIIVIGFVIARYVYTGWVKRKFTEGKWSAAWFTGTTVGVQLIHDLLFYFGVITQVPRGQNSMMDVFKDYAASGGTKILGADAAMMVGSSIVAILLKGMSSHLVAAFGIVVAYALPYILYTKAS